MGHSEMGLAVAGLKEDEITRRVRKLADGDWSEFPPSERLAFQFAYKLSREPSSISDKDVQGLVETFGRHRAVDVVWRSAWYNYMTRVADAFQLPLERENVFAILRKEREKEEKEKGAASK
jgi:hypothetical protein